jgi:Domain of unknown function (DUF1851)
MFRTFYEFFGIKEIDNESSYESNKYSDIQKNTLGFMELFSKYEGVSFGKGLYRLHKLIDIKKWNNIVLQAFPEFENRIECFGYDWLGRHFALDLGRLEAGEAQILMLEPGTGEVLEIPCNFIEFHNVEIPNYHDACLASSFYSEWLSKHPTNLSTDECIGYRVLLFLKGEDTISNLEKGDMEVYWSICTQLIKQTKNLPEGTIIRNLYLGN